MAGKSTAKGRKIGRNKIKCARYSGERRLEKNKKRKLARHLRNHGNDRVAVHAHAQIRI